MAVATDRSQKVAAPDAARPTGRFASVKEALDGFALARDRTLDLVRDMGAALYEVKVEHPILGTMNGVELAHVLDGHTMRHIAQIQELRATVAQ